MQLDGVDDPGLDAACVGEQEVLGEADEERVGGDLDRVVDGPRLGCGAKDVALFVGRIDVDSWERESKQGIDDGEADGSGKTDLSAGEESDPWTQRKSRVLNIGSEVFTYRSRPWRRRSRQSSCASSGRRGEVG